MSGPPTTGDLLQRLQALIDARRQAESSDVVFEIRDALWLAQYAQFPAGTEGETTTGGGQPSQPGPSPAHQPSTFPPTGGEPATPIPPIRQPAESTEEQHGLISGQQPAADDGEIRKASLIRTPSAAALPNALAIERALRPLRKRRPSARHSILDEDATVRELAAAKTAGVDLCLPRFRPATERWFELALVVDSGAEMDLWRRTIGDLRRLLGRQGAFADVRAWTLVNTGDGKFLLENNAASRQPFRILHHPDGRRLVLVLTQGTGAHWQDDGWRGELEKLAKNTPVGIVQFLPESLWPHTRLGPARRNARSHSPGDANHRLRLAASWQDTLDPGADLVPFPVLTLDPASIGAWANMVMARKGGFAPCFLLGRSASASPSAAEEWNPELAEQRVEEFRSIAPPAAFRLLCHFAAVPLTLPVMRIVREAMVPHATQADMGAILASGLLSVAGPSADPEMAFFAFLPGVDDILRESLRRGEERRTFASVKDEIRRFLETHIGRALPEDLSYLFDEEGEYQLSATAKAFVDVNRKTLERLGFRKTVLSTKTRWPGLSVSLLRANDHPTTSMLFEILERSLISSGYIVERIAELAEDRLMVEVFTKPSGAIVTVTAPSGFGLPIDFSNQRRWDASYRELVAYIDGTQDEPGALVGVPELPRPHLERTALQNALLYQLGAASPRRVTVTGPSFSGKRVLVAAAVREAQSWTTYRGGIYWEAQGTPWRTRPGRRLFIEPGPNVGVRETDAVITFDDPERGSVFEVGMLRREEADHCFLGIGGEAIRPFLSSLWRYSEGRLDKCAWLGVAIREFPNAFPIPEITDFFEWLLEQMGAVNRENLRRLAVLEGWASLPEPLIQFLIPDRAERETLYKQARSLCLMRRGKDGWWPLIDAVREELLRKGDTKNLHLRVVNYYERLTGVAHWEDGYFRSNYARHCAGAGRTDALERFFHDVDNLLRIIQGDGLEHLAEELRIYGLTDLASRVERLAPGQNVTREGLIEGLPLRGVPGRKYARDALRVILDTKSLGSIGKGLAEYLRDSGYSISQNFVDAEVLITRNASSSNYTERARNAGLLVVSLIDDTVTSSSLSQFDAVIDLDTDFEKLGGELLRLSLDLGQIYQVPVLPTPCLLREHVVGEARFALMQSERGLAITGDAGIGKTTLAVSLCRIAVVRRRFPGGVSWGTGNADPEMGPTLIVLDEDYKGTWPALRPVDRLIVIAKEFRSEEGMPSFPVPSLYSTEAQHVAGLYGAHGDSHSAIVKFAAGNIGLVCQAARIVRHFGWKSVASDFRLLQEGDGNGLGVLAARKLTGDQAKQIRSLSILGRNPSPTRELAEYVCGAPLAEDLFTLGLLKQEGIYLRVRAHAGQGPGPIPILHERVRDYYRETWRERFPLKVPAAESYYWKYIGHHLSRAGESRTLAAVSKAEEILRLADAEPEEAAAKLLESGTDLEDRLALLQMVQAAWLPRLTDPELEPEPETRAAIGRALAVLGLDNRKGIGLTPDGVPDIDWVEIPGGVFIYQKEKEPRHIDRFEIARYPVTNAQYQAFLDAKDGYKQDRWWEGLDRGDRTPQEPRWPEANNPRERVTWHEAMAFCAWLSDKLRRDVTLPTEWQWERAARGIDGREYPWSNQYVAGHANTDEKKEGSGPHHLERTSAVGIYPQGASPEGVLDLSGNVWEWCRNEFAKPDRTQAGGAESRVLRGGAWSSSSGRARADFRSEAHPDVRSNRFGFRMVCSAPIAEH